MAHVVTTFCFGSDLRPSGYELMDPAAFDKHSMMVLLKAQHKPELLYQGPRANLALGWLSWPDGPRRRGFTEKMRSRHLTRPARGLTWPNRAGHCSDSKKTITGAWYAKRAARLSPFPFLAVTAVSRAIGTV